MIQMKLNNFKDCKFSSSSASVSSATITGKSEEDQDFFQIKINGEDFQKASEKQISTPNHYSNFVLNTGSNIKENNADDDSIIIDDKIKLNRPAKIITKGFKRTFTNDFTVIKAKKFGEKEGIAKENSPLFSHKSKRFPVLKRYKTLSKTISLRNKLTSESIDEFDGQIIKMKTEKLLKPRRKRRRFKTNAKSIQKRSSNNLKFETNLLNLNDCSLHPPAYSQQAKSIMSSNSHIDNLSVYGVREEMRRTKNKMQSIILLSPTINKAMKSVEMKSEVVSLSKTSDQNQLSKVSNNVEDSDSASLSNNSQDDDKKEIPHIQKKGTEKSVGSDIKTSLNLLKDKANFIINSEVIKRIITHSEADFKKLKTIELIKKPEESKFKHAFELLKKKI